jgi:multiple sugar transport system ATP-binding protein
MDKGVIQQVAPPMEVYENPVNRFVAGFMGTPPMNFFDGRIDFKQETPIFTMDDTKLELPKRLKGNPAIRHGKQVVLGIRPEHLSLSPINGQTANKIQAIIDVIEPLGDRTHIYLTRNHKQNFIANTNPHMTVKPGEPITIYPDTERVHLFEPGEPSNNISLLTR